MSETSFYTIEDKKFVPIEDPVLSVPAPMEASRILMSVMRGISDGTDVARVREPDIEVRTSVRGSVRTN